MTKPDYQWRCPRCDMKFIERNVPKEDLGRCGVPGCPVCHSEGKIISASVQRLRIAVRPDNTVGLVRIRSAD